MNSRFSERANSFIHNIFVSASLPSKSKEVWFDDMTQKRKQASKHAVISGEAKFSCDRSLFRSIGLVTRRAYDRRGQLGRNGEEGRNGRTREESAS